MQFIYNGELINREDNVLLDKWKLDYVTGDRETPKPPMCIFKNTRKAIEMLNKHIVARSRTALHIDVDCDGIGSGYVLNRYLMYQGLSNIMLVINRDKVHGIQAKHAAYFKQNPVIDFIIISDSSCNEIEVIKQFNCDVLVIDHHEVLQNELSGKCNDGIHNFVIVNNTLDNDEFQEDISWLKARNINAFNDLEEYKGDPRMSCGLVIYELLRVYSECFNNPIILENLLLYQWAGVTLITDAIQLLTPRNQWYIDKTVHSMDVEPDLRIMMGIINRFKATLDKTYIGYSFAPVINKAIRAGQSNQALDVVINHPENIGQLDEYKKMQEDAVNSIVYINYNQIKQAKQEYLDMGWTEEKALQELRMKGYVTDLVPREYKEEFIMENITGKNVSPNYTGVIAGRLVGEHNKNTVCFRITDTGMAKGSFRGRNQDTDYRKYFEDTVPGIYAQGHPPAFGFECKYEDLQKIMQGINSIETESDNREYFSVGNIPDSEKGVLHIVDFQDFKRNGYLLRIAVGNSKVANKDEVYIKVNANDIKLKETKGKLYIYDCMGLECKAFKQLNGQYFKLYLEFTNEMVAYLK